MMGKASDQFRIKMGTDNNRPNTAPLHDFTPNVEPTIAGDRGGRELGFLSPTYWGAEPKAEKIQ